LLFVDYLSFRYRLDPMDPQRFNPANQVPGPSTLQSGDSNLVQGQQDIERAVTGNSNEKMDRINVQGNLNTKLQQK